MRANFQRVVRKKADALCDMVRFQDLDFQSQLLSARKVLARAEQMPTRGYKQRVARDAAIRAVDEMTDRFALRIGRRVMETYDFLRRPEIKIGLTRKQRRILGL